MRPVRVGVVGAGHSAALLVGGLRLVRGVDVSVGAVAASRPESAAAFARANGVPDSTGDYRELLANPAIDAVCLCVPNSLHASLAVEAARAGKHVICEKPLTGAFGDADGGPGRARRELARAQEAVAEIETAVRRAGVLFMYAENWVYAPSMTTADRLVATAGGAILDIRAEQSHGGSHVQRSRHRSSAGGGSLLILGSHAVAAALHLKAQEGLRLRGAPIRPVSVTADTTRLYESEAWRSRKHGWLVDDWDDVETWATSVLAFDDGTRAVVTASFAMLGGVRNVFEVYTTDAVIRASMTPNDALLAYAPDERMFGDIELHEKAETHAGWTFASPEQDWVRGYPQEMQDFAECVATGREPLSGFDLARGVVDVVYTSYVAADEGRRVELSTGGR